MPGIVAMIGVLGDILVHLGFERGQQHASGTLAHQRVEVDLERILLSLFRSDYSQHAAYLSMDGFAAARLQQPGGYAALLTAPRIHNFRLYLNRARRIAVVESEIAAIHLVCDQHLPLNCFVSGQTAGERDRTGRYRLFSRRSPIGSFEHDLTCPVVHASAIQQVAQRHAGPFRIVECAELPLCPFNLGDEEGARLLPAHSKVAIRVSDGMSRNSL
jgi:hypothetical protein